MGKFRKTTISVYLLLATKVTIAEQLTSLGLLSRERMNQIITSTAKYARNVTKSRSKNGRLKIAYPYHFQARKAEDRCQFLSTYSRDLSPRNLRAEVAEF